MSGAHLVCALLKQGHKIRAAKYGDEDENITKKCLSFYFDDYENLFSEIEWVDVSRCDIFSLTEAMQEVKTVFYCLRPALNTKRTLEDNIEEIRSVLNAAREAQIGYFYYISTLDALGYESDYKEITEDTQRNPKGNYPAVSDLEYRCETEVFRALNEDLKGSVLNTGIILGPGDWKSDSSRMFSLSMTWGYYTKGVTGFVGVYDVIKCLLALERKKICGERFIAVSENLSYHQIMKIITQKFGIKEPLKFAGKFRLAVYKCCYIVKSLLTGRRPVADTAYFNRITSFNIYSNKKSIGRLIVNYEDIESVIEKICNIYVKDNIPEIKKIYKFA